MEDSRQSVAALQSQLEDYRERSRKDLQEVQRNNKDRLVELQRAQNNLKAQQDEVGTQGVRQGGVRSNQQRPLTTEETQGIARL